jgi:hypothetical protein
MSVSPQNAMPCKADAPMGLIVAERLGLGGTEDAKSGIMLNPDEVYINSENLGC